MIGAGWQAATRVEYLSGGAVATSHVRLTCASIPPRSASMIAAQRYAWRAILAVPPCGPARAGAREKLLLVRGGRAHGAAHVGVPPVFERERIDGRNRQGDDSLYVNFGSLLRPLAR
ncbi:MAG TPA: hypothetical protein VGC55_07830 [Dokdonella sp.]